MSIEVVDRESLERNPEIIFGVGVLVISPEGKVLLVQENSSNSSLNKKPGQWSIPGGHRTIFEDRTIEPSEVAARRELREEAGATVKRLNYVATYRYGNYIGDLYIARANNFQGPQSTSEISEVAWFSVSDIGDLQLRPFVKEIIQTHYPESIR